MSTNIQTFEDLLNNVNARIQERLRGPVSNIVENELHKNSQIAKGSYSRSSGGVGDRRNIVSHVSTTSQGVELLVQNIAEPQESVFGTNILNTPYSDLFSTWINDGLWMDLDEYLRSGRKVKRSSRPFVNLTQSTINGPLKHQIENEISKGF